MSAEVAEKYRLAALKCTEEGELEVDEGAPVSMGDDDGAYVQGWIWVPNEEAGVETKTIGDSGEWE